MKCQILFSRKIKKNTISLSSAEFAHRWKELKHHSNLQQMKYFVFCPGKNRA